MYLLNALNLFQGITRSALRARAFSGEITRVAVKTPLAMSCARSSCGNKCISSVSCSAVLPTLMVLRCNPTSLLRRRIVLKEAVPDPTRGVVTFVRLRGYKRKGNSVTSADPCMLTYRYNNGIRIMLCTIV